MDAMVSADGWLWTEVEESAAPASIARDVLVAGGRVIAVGIGTGEVLEGWFGSAVITR